MENIESNPQANIKFQHIESHLHELRDECLEEISHAADSREEAYLRAAADVLEGLEKSFQHYAQEKRHIYSPKSTDPWD